MDNWMRAHRKVDGKKSALCHGIPHSDPIFLFQFCPGGGVYHLRCVSLVGHGADLAQPHVLDDRHDRPGWKKWRADHQERGSRRGIQMEDVCRAPGGKRCPVGKSISRMTIMNATSWNYSKAFSGIGRKVAVTSERPGSRSRGADLNTMPSMTSCRPSRGSFPPVTNRNIRIIYACCRCSLCRQQN